MKIIQLYLGFFILFLFQWLWWGVPRVYSAPLVKELVPTFILMQQVTKATPNFTKQGLIYISMSNQLSPEEEQRALQEIDAMCADTWCEGSFDFEFHTFRCSFLEGLCVLGFKFISVYDEELGLLKIDVENVCTLFVDSYSELWDKSFQLLPHIYEQISYCIEDSEAAYRRGNR